MKISENKGEYVALVFLSRIWKKIRLKKPKPELKKLESFTPFSFLPASPEKRTY